MKCTSSCMRLSSRSRTRCKFSAPFFSIMLALCLSPVALQDFMLSAFCSLWAASQDCLLQVPGCCHSCFSSVQASRLSCLPALGASRLLRTIILGFFQGICGALAKLLREVDSLYMLQELTTNRIVAEADLSKQLGTLRYLLGLRSARQRAEAAQERAVKLKEGQGAQGMHQLIRRQPYALLSMLLSLHAMQHMLVAHCMISSEEVMLLPLGRTCTLLAGLLPQRAAIEKVPRAAVNCLTLIP